MKSSQPKKHPEQLPDLLERIRPEQNIEKWSIWLPANSRTELRERVFEREVELPDGGKAIGRLTVAPTTKGNLTTEDQRVYYALVKIWEERGRPESFTPISLRLIAKVLRRKWNAETGASIRASLTRLRMTGFIWERTYEDGSKKNKLGLLEPFNILADLKIVRREHDGHVTTEAGYFLFHEAILKNLRAGYTKPVLLDVVLSFKSEIAQILYTHLDLILSRTTSYERRTKELFDELGLEGKEYQKVSRRIRRLEPALKELQGKPITTGKITTAKLVPTKDGTDFKLVVRKGKATKAITDEPTSNVLTFTIATEEEHPPSEAEELVKHFHKVFHGTAEVPPTAKAIGQAETLIARLGIAKARHIVDYAHREAPKTRYKVATFGGIMQYEAPALRDFEKAERDREQQRATQRAAEAQRRREAEEAARDEARRAAAKQRWESLSEAERAEVERSAFASQANTWHVSQYNRCKRDRETDRAERYRWQIIEAHLIAEAST